MYPVAAKSIFLCSDKNTSCFFSPDFFFFGGGGGGITAAKDKDLRLWHFVHSAFTEANFLHVLQLRKERQISYLKVAFVAAKQFFHFVYTGVK